MKAFIMIIFMTLNLGAAEPVRLSDFIGDYLLIYVSENSENCSEQFYIKSILNNPELQRQMSESSEEGILTGGIYYQTNNTPTFNDWKLPNVISARDLTTLRPNEDTQVGDRKVTYKCHQEDKEIVCEIIERVPERGQLKVKYRIIVSLQKNPHGELQFKKVVTDSQETLPEETSCLYGSYDHIAIR